MKRLAQAIEFLAWAVFFAFAALVLALRFWLLPDIERHRERIVAAVSKTVGLPVKIGSIEAGWLGLNPQVSLGDVRILDAQGREALALRSVENVISWKSVFTGDLRLHSLTIDGPRVAVRRDAEGNVHVAGLMIGGKAGDRGFSDWILAQDEIAVRNAEVEWLDDKRGAPPLALSALNLRLRNAGREHSIGLSARPPAELGSTLELRAELLGHTITEPEAWNGRIYLELGYTDLAGWRAWVDYPLDVRKGQGALRLWATLQNGEPSQATADVALAGVAARLRKDLPLVELATLSGRIQGALKDGGYEIAGRKLALVSERGPGIEPTDFQLNWKPQGKDPERGSLTARQLDLQPLAALAEQLPLPAELRKRVTEVDPRGRVTEARLEWTGSLADPATLGGKGKFSDLAVRAHGQLPGFSGLSGSIDATESKGSVQFASRKAELDLPCVLDQPRVPLDMLEGQVDWDRPVLVGNAAGGSAGAAKGLNVRIGALAFANEHIEGKASGSYAWMGAGPGTIDLEAAFKRGEGAHVRRYLPLPDVMGKEVHDYLATAIIAGKGSDGQLRLKGDLKDFPFVDPAKGQFRMTARVEQGVLEYVTGWPRIRDIDAELLFERDRMEIVSRSANVLGARLSNVRVAIPNLKVARVVLQVSGQADGPNAEFLKFVESSPVQRMAGGFTDGIHTDGRGKLRLKLELPLQALEETKVAGEYDLAANSLSVHPSLPPLERVAGQLSFTDSSLTLHDLRGRFLGGPVVVSGGSRPGGGVEILAKGDVAVAATQPVFDHPWRRYLAGAAPYTATVHVRDGRTRLSFESTLRGVTSTLPPPFFKSAAEAMPLRVEVIPAEGGARDRVSIAVARIAAVELLRRRQGETMTVQRAGISLSPAPDEAVRVPERAGALVYGSLAELDLDRWMALSPPAEEQKPAEPAGPEARRAEAEVLANSSFELKIGSLDVLGKRMREVQIRAGADGAGWSATVQSQEMAGDVSFRGEKGGQLIARMSHFRIPDEYPGARPAEAYRQKDLPSVDLVAERFTYKDKQLGRVEIFAQRAGPDWRIDRFSVVNPEASMAGKGLWKPGEVRGDARAAPSLTSLDVNIESSDAGKFLERIGYPGLVRGAKAKVQAGISWAGDPMSLDYPSLTGVVQLQSEDGQFLEIEPGFGKLVSLMSLQALPKRLTLDFRDVFSKGFQFDRIASAANIERGVMTIKDFKMQGSAAEVEMAGEVDLAKETQNLQVRVVPSLGDTASTVIGLINPLLLFPAAIAQRILKDPLGHIFSFNYTITGSWSDPKVAKRGVDAKEVRKEGGG